MKNILLIASFLVIGCGGGNSSINQEGYFKHNKNRITTHSFKSGTSEQEIKLFASELMNTPGRMTAAYFYPEGSILPRDGITLAENEIKANYVLYDMPGFNKWKYAYMKYSNGTIVFVDCQVTPNHDLCRQN